MGASQALLPIFPLSNVVLFPGVATPLHLFEPRYRQLARDVLAGERCIGMVVVRPEFADEMSGDPPVFPIGCAGRIAESQRLPDGRYNLVLRGESRFRVLEEPPRPGERLYRCARVEYLDDPYDEAERDRVSRLRASITEDVGVLVRRTQPERSEGLRPDLFTGVDDATFVNLLSNAFALPVEDKQGLLEAETIPARFARLASVLRFQRAELDAETPHGPERLH
jgi:Lon protease-like protein